MESESGLVVDAAAQAFMTWPFACVSFDQLLVQFARHITDAVTLSTNGTYYYCANSEASGSSGYHWVSSIIDIHFSNVDAEPLLHDLHFPPHQANGARPGVPGDDSIPSSQEADDHNGDHVNPRTPGNDDYYQDSNGDPFLDHDEMSSLSQDEPRDSFSSTQSEERNDASIEPFRIRFSFGDNRATDDGAVAFEDD